MFADLAGVRVYYEVEGSGSPVCLLHGWGAAASAMRLVVDGLKADHTVYALDFPGFGQSALPPAPWGVDEYRQVVEELLAAVDAAPAVVVGHSFGGRVGIKLAAERPNLVSKLVLVDSAGIRPSLSPQQVLTRAVFRAGKAAIGAPGFGGLRARAEAVARSRVGSEDYKSAGPLRETFVKVVNEDLRPLLPRIQAPTLLIWGELDDATPLSDAKQIEREIPDAGLVVFKGAGHFSYLDRPDDFVRIVRTFLAQP
jgi:pimeloyl-ACP methyl ester carboxylesterase